MRIILDAMGGDNAPLEIVKGALQAHRDFGVDIVLTGREEDIRQAAAQCGETLPEGVTIRHCTETIEMCDDPALACRRKKDSSMTVGLQMLRAGEGDAFISAGSLSYAYFTFSRNRRFASFSVWAISAHLADSNRAASSWMMHTSVVKPSWRAFRMMLRVWIPSKYSRCSGVILNRVGFPSLSVIQ